MAEMELDDLSKGCRQVNFEKYGHEALAAASRAAGKFIEQQQSTDLNTWSAEEWDRFIWQTLSAGLYEATNLTRRRYQEILAAVDEIPYA